MSLTMVSEREVVFLAITWPGSIQRIDAIALCRPWGTSGGRSGLRRSGLGSLGGLWASISGVLALAPARKSQLIGQPYFGFKTDKLLVM